MNRKFEFLIVLLSSIVITAFFHRQAPGLNLLATETFIVIWLRISNQYRFKKKNQITCGIGLLLTALFTVITHSVFSYIINFLVLFLFVGILIYPEAKSVLSILGLSISNLFNSQSNFLKELSKSKIKGHKIGGYFRKFRIFIIPLIIILVFIAIYRSSNPLFDKFASTIVTFIQKLFSSVFKDFDFLIILSFLISLSISIFIFFRTSNKKIIDKDLASADQLKRIKKKSHRNFKTTALRNEYKAGVFLLIFLNTLILILNAIDINWVWFNFEWEGQYLKQFVHQGTYLLILSILISIALVLYFFRNNLNFYSKNPFLKYLSYIWIAQNSILTISVGIRNFYYIQYFSLAYKRIGVILFLILTIYGLYTVFIKVLKGKSSSYLFKSNSYALLLVLILSSIINWDSYIAKYNFKHSDKSFLHLDYLSTLSDKSLPYLDKTLSELQEIEKVQIMRFPFEEKFMDPETYYQIIKERKAHFLKKWESKNILSWNLPEYMAYRKLINKSVSAPNPENNNK